MTSVSHLTFKAALLAPPFPRHCFTIVGYQTAEQVSAFIAGDRTLFDDIEEWLDDNLPDQRSMSAQSDSSTDRSTSRFQMSPTRWRSSSPGAK